MIELDILELHLSCSHNSDVTCASCHLKSPATGLFIQQLVHAYNRKHQGFKLLVLCDGNPPVTGGFPLQRASNRKAFSCHNVLGSVIGKHFHVIMSSCNSSRYSVPTIMSELDYHDWIFSSYSNISCHDICWIQVAFMTMVLVLTKISRHYDLYKHFCTTLTLFYCVYFVYDYVNYFNKCLWILNVWAW